MEQPDMFHELPPELREGPFKIPENYFESLPPEVNRVIVNRKKFPGRQEIEVKNGWITGVITFITITFLAGCLFIPSAHRQQNSLFSIEPVAEDTYSLILVNNMQDETFSTILEKEYILMQDQSCSNILPIPEKEDDSSSLSREDIIMYLTEQNVTYAEIVNIY